MVFYSVKLTSKTYILNSSRRGAILREVSMAVRIYLSLFGLALFLCLLGIEFLYGAEQIRTIVLSRVESILLDGQKMKLEVAAKAVAEAICQ